MEPMGLMGYPGLHKIFRDGDPTAGTNPQAVDFYSPDTFNFTVLDVSRNGKTLTVTSIGMDATAQNAGIEYANGPQARVIFRFKVDAAHVDKDRDDDRDGMDDDRDGEDIDKHSTSKGGDD